MTDNRRSILNDLSGTSLDEGMDLTMFMNNTQQRQAQNTNKATVQYSSIQPSSVEAKSALQKAKEAKEAGMVVNTQEVIENAKPKPIQNYALNETRQEDIKRTLLEMDDTIEKRKHIIVTKLPQNSSEYTVMMEEIDSIAFTESGEAYYNMTEDVQTQDGVDDYGNPVIVNKTVPIKGWQPRYTRLRTSADPAYSPESEQKLMEAMHGIKTGEVKSENIDNKFAEGVAENGVVKEEAQRVEKIESIKLIIDKTGMGANIDFTPEERAKLNEATEIRLREVKTVDLKSIRIKKKDRSLKEIIEAQNNIVGGRLTVCYPASGFRAHMTPMTYGELGDLSMDMEGVTFNKYWKRLSIIYNKMKNITGHTFGSFEEWLKGFAYTDIPLALYGLYVATYPDTNTLQMRCGKDDCKKAFNWSFSTRNILRLENCNLVFLNKMKEIANCSTDKLTDICDKSPVNNSNRIELPFSGYLVDIGIVSAYEFLYNIIPVLNEETFRSKFGEDPNGIYQRNALLLTTVRAVYVPTDDGEYYECTDYEDILNALYQVRPEDIKLLFTLTAKYTNEYTPSFALTEVKCPHCGNVSGEIELTMDDLVFQTYQALMSTDIDVENMPNL